MTRYDKIWRLLVEEKKWWGGDKIKIKKELPTLELFCHKACFGETFSLLQTWNLSQMHIHCLFNVCLCCGEIKL